MSVDFHEKQWGCGKSHAVKLQRMGSMVCDMGDPCFHQSSLKANKMLRPDKWQSVFDSDGKAVGFQKALKFIILGGVDPSIRSEVWEFLLGCYELSSTREHRELLRAARRERYEELVKECQKMHSSIGTGSLAYVVGSKIMDVRTYSKDNMRTEVEDDKTQSSKDSNHSSKVNGYNGRNNNCTDTTYKSQRESSSDSSDSVSVRESVDSAAYDSSSLVPSPCKRNFNSGPRKQSHASQHPRYNLFDFPPLPVTNLFEKSEGEEVGQLHNAEDSNNKWKKSKYEEESMHSFQIGNNEELIIESHGSPSERARHFNSSEIEPANGHINEHHEQSRQSSDILNYKNKVLSRLRISDVPETEPYSSNHFGDGPSDDKISEWLWTLHRIVVDVVRTDSHLEFYEDPKNLARMSDILAVYAWVDPETGYCQGMSDMLSPFVVIFEDDADAFWCFEMLLRRTRENFRMEGQTGVMKQLQTLWHILKITDREMFSHLAHIGAESLIFAFRMLLVLFRRELSFNEALCMWEMMWAADFDESLSWNLAQKCLEPLVLQVPVPDELGTADVGGQRKEMDDGNTEGGSYVEKHANIEPASPNEAVMKSVRPNNSFCGLTRTFLSRNGRMHLRSRSMASRNQENELPVFCVAAILILNRHKVVKETHSIDDLIKIFNDNDLKIKVKRCVRTAIKLRRKYFYKLIRKNNLSPPNEQ